MRLIVILCLICLISSASALNRKKKLRQHIVKNENLYAVDPDIKWECRDWVDETFQMNADVFQQGEDQCLAGLYLPEYETSQEQVIADSEACLEPLYKEHTTEYQALLSYTQCIMDHMVFEYVPNQEFDPEDIPMAEGHDQPDYPEPQF